MENKYTKSDKIIGTMYYLAYRINPLTYVRAGEAEFHGVPKSHFMKTLESFILSSQQKRLEKNKNIITREHRSYHNHPEI